MSWVQFLKRDREKTINTYAPNKIRRPQYLIINNCMTDLVIITMSHCNILGGGRNDVDPRFISLFSVFNMTFPAEESLYLIYSSILNGHVQPFSEEIQGLVPTITNMTMELYKYVYCLLLRRVLLLAHGFSIFLRRNTF